MGKSLPIFVTFCTFKGLHYIYQIVTVFFGSLCAYWSLCAPVIKKHYFMFLWCTLSCSMYHEIFVFSHTISTPLYLKVSTVRAETSLPEMKSSTGTSWATWVWASFGGKHNEFSINQKFHNHIFLLSSRGATKSVITILVQFFMNWYELMFSFLIFVSGQCNN